MFDWTCSEVSLLLGLYFYYHKFYAVVSCLVKENNMFSWKEICFQQSINDTQFGSIPTLEMYNKLWTAFPRNYTTYTQHI